MDFVILKVNGQDVSNSSHEDAVRCFQSAEEPIIVEVLRRQPGRVVIQVDNDGVMTKNENVTRNGETESTSLNSSNEDSTWKRSSLKSNNAFPFVSTGVQTDWAGLTDEDQLLPVSLNPEEPTTNDSFDDFLTHDIDFEEVTLQKTGSAEKLGLTVCYSSGSGSEDADTEVYISEIIPESLAARDGRLREGDQILRVNGKDVANKQQTENLFAETKNAVTILVSRCLYQDDDYDDRRIYIQDSPPISPDNIPAYQNSMIEQLIIRQQQQQQVEDSKAEENGEVDVEQQLVPQDSSHKEGDINSLSIAAPPVPSHTNQQISLEPVKLRSQNSQKSSLSHQPEDRKQWLQDALKECTKSVDCMGLRSEVPTAGHHAGTTIAAVKLVDAYSSHVWSDTEHIYETIPESDNEPIYSSPYEHHRHWMQLNSGQQMKQCEQIQPPQQQTAKPWHSSSKSNSSGEEKDSSSAYNTGESCHSNPLTLELHQVEKDCHKSTLVLCPPAIPAPTTTTTTQKIGCSCPMPVAPLVNKPTSKNQSTWRKSSSHHQHRERDNCTLSASNTTTLPADTMYTNVANLQQTMILQQRLFKQALNRKNLTTTTRESSGTRKSKSHGNFQAPNLTQYQFIGSQQVCATTSTGTTTTNTTTNTTSSWNTTTAVDKDPVEMEWKVKRRPDGTRYIARRPIRSRVLRNRAIKISEERAGHTTEDDTMSEMKVGRYWTKDERKRQLERAKERKRQQELILIQQQTRLQGNTDLLISDHTEEKLAKKPLNIVDSSHKKMARKKATVDDFTTVQEMLLHGNRVSGTGGSGIGSGGGGGGSVAAGKLMGLLSVTTV